MVLTARVCGVGFHAGESCAGIAMWGWPTYLSVVEGSELQLAHRNDLRSDPEDVRPEAADPVAAAALA